MVSMVMSIHLCHVIAHPLQLHGDSKEVELMEAGNIGIKSFFRAWFNMLVHQGVINTGCTLASNFFQRGIVNAL